MLSSLVLGISLSVAVTAYQYDTVMQVSMGAPQECDPGLGCAAWSDLAGSYNSASQSSVDAFWINATKQASAGSSCAIPGNFGVPQGALCYCAGTAGAPVSTWGYCLDPPIPTPQQVNIQFGANGDEIQIAFVTLDEGAPLAFAPSVEWCDGSGRACVNISGATTRAPEPQLPSRVYSYSFVPIPQTLYNASLSYVYRARGPTAFGASSPWFRTKARAPGPLRFALFGDQGVYPFSNMGNIYDDVAADAVSFVVHLGDVAYNMAMEGGGRGDGWFYAMEPVLSQVPWFSSIGNHEFEGASGPRRQMPLHVSEDTAAREKKRSADETCLFADSHSLRVVQMFRLVWGNTSRAPWSR